MADMIEIIKKAALDAFNEKAPTSILFGTVMNVNPLEIQIEQKMILGKEFLILTKNVIDYTINVSLDWNTETKSLNANHSHSVNGNIHVNSSISPNPNNSIITNTINSSLAIESKEISLSHSHKITGTKTITIHNALRKGDGVILLQIQGGQKFVVLDKIY